MSCDLILTHLLIQGDADGIDDGHLLHCCYNRLNTDALPKGSRGRASDQLALESRTLPVYLPISHTLLNHSDYHQLSSQR